MGRWGTGSVNWSILVHTSAKKSRRKGSRSQVSSAPARMCSARTSGAAVPVLLGRMTPGGGSWPETSCEAVAPGVATPHSCSPQAGCPAAVSRAQLGPRSAGQPRADTQLNCSTGSFGQLVDNRAFAGKILSSKEQDIGFFKYIFSVHFLLNQKKVVKVTA